MQGKEEKNPLLGNHKLGFYNQKRTLEKEESALIKLLSNKDLIRIIAGYLDFLSLVRFSQVNRGIYSAIVTAFADNNHIALRHHPNFNHNPMDFDIEANHRASAPPINPDGSPYSIGQLLLSLQNHNQIVKKIAENNHDASSKHESAQILADCIKDPGFFKSSMFCAVLLGLILGSGAGWAYSAIFNASAFINMPVGAALGEVFFAGLILGILYGSQHGLRWLGNRSQQRADQLSADIATNPMTPLIIAINNAVRKESQEQHKLEKEELENCSTYYTP